jgi:acetyl-CoA C-acetyltransferase
VIMGCALPEGATGANIARQVALRAGCPDSVSGLTVNRFCSSGLQSIALAAQRIIAGEGDMLCRRWRRIDLDCAIDGQCKISMKSLGSKNMRPESIGACSEQQKRSPAATGLIARLWMNMALAVSNDLSRSSRRLFPRRDCADYGHHGQCRQGERAPYDSESHRRKRRRSACTARRRRGVSRHSTSASGRRTSPVAMPSQFSDGAGAVVVMSAKEAERRGLEPLGVLPRICGCWL